MKKFLILGWVFFFLLLTNSLSQTVSLKTASSEAVEQKIFKEIIKLPYYSVFDCITYKVDGETVILAGKVTVARNKSDAEYAVGRVKGIAHIVNNIEILPLSPFDDSIRVRLIRVLVNRGGNLFLYLQEPNPSIRIIVKGGHVTLEGFVANRSDYNLMGILANGVSDVFSVTNNLVVEKEVIR